MFFFFFNDTATTEIYTLSLHDALPISLVDFNQLEHVLDDAEHIGAWQLELRKRNNDPLEVDELILHVHKTDRKSTRLNSSHSQISYAVFCLKKKNNPDIK